MEEWKSKLQNQAALMREKANARSEEEKRASIQKARDTRRKNREARLAAGVEVPKIGRPRKTTVTLDDLAQQMGFASASEALLEMAVKKAGFASVQDAAMWAVKEKTRPKTDTVTATVGQGWSGFDD